MRRNRRDPWTRRLVAENTLTVDDLIWPVFVQEGERRTTPITSMPGVARLSIDRLIDAVGEAAGLGVPAIAIFPVVEERLQSAEGEDAWNHDTLVCRQVSAVKVAFPHVGLPCEVSLDPFTSPRPDGPLPDGHCVNYENLEEL